MKLQIKQIIRKHCVQNNIAEVLLDLVPWIKRTKQMEIRLAPYLNLLILLVMLVQIELWLLILLRLECVMVDQFRTALWEPRLPGPVESFGLQIIQT